MLNLRSFEIYNLNGADNIKINFDENVRILIAENGFGKTTVMNIMYYALKNNVNELKKYNFKKCVLKFEGMHDVIFEKSKLSNANYKQRFDTIYYKARKQGSDSINSKFRLFEKIGAIFLKSFGSMSFQSFMYNYFMVIISNTSEVRRGSLSTDKRIVAQFLRTYQNNELGFDELWDEYILDELMHISYQDLVVLYCFFERNYFFQKKEISFNNKDTHSLVYEVLKYALVETQKDNEQNKEVLNELEKRLIFLPTYRRIEHDFIDLLSGEYRLKEDSVLSSGMADVNNLFNKISEKLNKYIEDSFNKIKNNALNEFISGNTLSLDNYNLYYDREYLTNMLRRVGKGIDEKNKAILIDTYQDNSYLMVLVSKMSEIYNNLRIVEDDINKYIDVCNKYLFNKYLFYNSESINIEVYKQHTNTTAELIHLTNLSSGEKQIISLFAKLYLSHIPNLDFEKHEFIGYKHKYWILFDEPELSLSVEWQEMILPDILNSERCKLLFATTHSPFIFKNELRYHTSHFSECTRMVE